MNINIKNEKLEEFTVLHLMKSFSKDEISNLLLVFDASLKHFLGKDIIGIKIDFITHHKLTLRILNLFNEFISKKRFNELSDIKMIYDLVHFLYRNELIFHSIFRDKYLYYLQDDIFDRQYGFLKNEDLSIEKIDKIITYYNTRPINNLYSNVIKDYLNHYGSGSMLITMNADKQYTINNSAEINFNYTNIEVTKINDTSIRLDDKYLINLKDGFISQENNYDTLNGIKYIYLPSEILISDILKDVLKIILFAIMSLPSFIFNLITKPISKLFTEKSKELNNIKCIDEVDDKEVKKSSMEMKSIENNGSGYPSLFLQRNLMNLKRVSERSILNNSRKEEKSSIKISIF